jgi:membrane protein CcdC involved in cytochrome C biogenesis
MPQRIINLIAFLDALPLFLRIPVGLGMGLSIVLVIRMMVASKASANNRGSLLMPFAATAGAVVLICKLITLSIDWKDL